MASICRVCQQSVEKGLIPLSNAVFNMLITVGGPPATTEMDEYDRLPQHVCHLCLMRLEETCSLRTFCRRSVQKLLLNPATGGTGNRCLMCRSEYGEKELIAADEIHERWKMKISEMIEQLIDIELVKDRSEKHICINCSNKLYLAYAFMRQCIKSETHWSESVIYPWEKMALDYNDPEHLVADLFAHVVQSGEGKGYCSICRLSVDLDQVGEKCDGCWLEFRVEVPTIAGEESSDDLTSEIKCEEEVEFNSQEVDPLTEEGNNGEHIETESSKVSESNAEVAAYVAEPEEIPNPHTANPGYVEEPEKVFDIIEEYPDDPYPAVRRKGPWCFKCFKFFATKSDLADHQAQTHPASSCSGTLPCEFCKSNADHQTWTRHKKSMATFVFDFCKSCQIVFESPIFLQNHKFKYHIDTEAVKSYYDTDTIFYYDCCVPNCSNRYSSEEYLQKHLKVAHGKEQDPVQENMCQYCKTLLINESHVLRHWRIERLLYKCRVEGCNYMRINKKAMLVHCSQKPHSKHVYKKRIKTKILVPDIKQFTVIGQLDSNTDILRRQGQLCCRCLLIFDTKEELAAHCELHISTDRDDQPVQCDICGRRFATKSHLSYHIKLQGKHYYCRPCKTFLWRKGDYRTHKAREHLYDDDLSDRIETVEDHSFTCCGCWQPFFTEDELVEHRRKYHPPILNFKSLRPLACDYCRQSKDTTEILEQHISFYESKFAYKCKAPGCFVQTKNMNHIRRHVLLHKYKDNNDPNQCSSASEESPSGGEDDLAGSSENDRPRSVERKRLKTKRARSLARKRLNSTKRWECSFCDQVMPTYYQLRKHLRQIHAVLNDTSHVCNICGVVREKIDCHMKLHNKKRIHKCSTCGAGFHTTLLLKNHQRTHSVEKDFPCRKGCARRYKAPGDRTRHENWVHLGIKPFACNLCSKSFGRDRELRLHKRVHTGLRPYSCTICSESFVKVGEYEDHCKICMESIE